MVLETRIQSQVESYQRFEKWYLMPPCLALSIIRYRSRVKWSNPGKGVAPFPTPWFNSYWKGSLWVTLDCICQLYFTFFFFFFLFSESIHCDLDLLYSNTHLKKKKQFTLNNFFINSCYEFSSNPSLQGIGSFFFFFSYFHLPLM